MKVYLEAKSDPWVVWDKLLWIDSQKNPIDGVEITVNANGSDVLVLEYDKDAVFDLDKPMLVYVESIEEGTIADLKATFMPFKSKVEFMSDSFTVLKKINNEDGMVCHYWTKPSRVPEKLWTNNSIDEKTDDFIVVSNASRQQDNISKLVQDFMMVSLTKATDGAEDELMFKNSLHIFSAQEPPFEPFNNIVFHGHQPNPMLFKYIRKSKLFISPYCGNGLPISAVDAALLGTPVLVRDTESNRAMFPWGDLVFYENNKELKEKMKVYMNMDVDMYSSIVERNFEIVSNQSSIKNSKESLLSALMSFE